MLEHNIWDKLYLYSGVLVIHIWHQDKWSLFPFEVKAVFLHWQFSQILAGLTDHRWGHSSTHPELHEHSVSSSSVHVLVLDGTSKSLLSKWIQLFLNLESQHTEIRFSSPMFPLPHHNTDIKVFFFLSADYWTYGFACTRHILFLWTRFPSPLCISYL